jgi:hypothetical protein
MASSQDLDTLAQFGIFSSDGSSQARGWSRDAGREDRADPGGRGGRAGSQGVPPPARNGEAVALAVRSTCRRMPCRR